MQKYYSISVCSYVHKNAVDARFFKKYKCFDGIGSFYFDSLKEANRYVLNRSRIVSNALIFSLSQFPVISKYYIDNLVSLRVYTAKGAQVNEYLQDCLTVIKYLTSNRCKNEYVLGKLIYLLERYLSVTKMLDKVVLSGVVKKYLDSLLISYPVYWSSDYQLKISHNEKVKFSVVRKAA
jgi:hypothetical protein